MKLIRLVFFALLVLLGSANATVVSVGSLTSNDDGSTSIITDSLNGREWLRWDVLKGLTYAQTVDLIATGSTYAGWQIARNSDALQFLSALIGPNTCGPVSFGVCINSVSDDVPMLTGDSYSPNIQGGPYNDFDDYVYFLSDNGFGYEVGVIETLKFPGAATGSVFFKHEQWQIVNADFFGTTRRNEEMGWLLYRDSSLSVSEPGSFWLAILAVVLTNAGRRVSSTGRGRAELP